MLSADAIGSIQPCAVQFDGKSCPARRVWRSTKPGRECLYEGHLAANPHRAGGHQARTWYPEDVRPLKLILVCELKEIVSGGTGMALTVLHHDLSGGLPSGRCVARTGWGLVLTCLPGVHWRRKASFAFTTLARSSSACLAVRRLRHHRLPTYQTRSPTPHTTL